MVQGVLGGRQAPSGGRHGAGGDQWRGQGPEARGAGELKAVVAEQALELRLLKKSMIAEGGDEE